MKEHMPSTLPPLRIEYRDQDDSVFVSERPPVTAERAATLFQICKEAIELQATIKNPFPAHIGGIERLEELKLLANENNTPLQHLQSNGEYGIIR